MNTIKATPKPGRYVLQVSKNGVEWDDSIVTLKSQTAAQKYFDSLANTDELDWRVSFVMRFRNGKHYRVFDSKTGTTLYKK